MVDSQVVNNTHIELQVSPEMMCGRALEASGSAGSPTVTWGSMGLPILTASHPTISVLVLHRCIRLASI